MTAPIAQVKSLDHIVLTVSDINTTVDWYTAHLGMKHESFTSPKDPSVTRHSLLFGSQKINLHKSGAEFEPKAAYVMPGSGDLCFLSETSVDDVLRALQGKGVEVLEGGEVVDRKGARGMLRSVYIRDPDGNLVECVLPQCDASLFQSTYADNLIGFPTTCKDSMRTYE